MVVVLVLLPGEARVQWGEVALALLLLAGAGLGLAAAAGGHERRGSTLASMCALLAAIALLRNGVGANSGFGPLIFLPVMWAALERRRTELLVVLLGVAAVYFLPMIIAGPPHIRPAAGAAAR